MRSRVEEICDRNNFKVIRYDDSHEIQVKLEVLDKCNEEEVTISILKKDYPLRTLCDIGRDNVHELRKDISKELKGINLI